MFVTIDPSSDAPLYRQIAEGVERELAAGHLKPGDKLPTVRTLAQELCAAHGTVKRAYDELCRRGVVEMAQGRGTFIARQEPPDSRKERAMTAIDGLLDCLGELAFSPQEIWIFLELKLRERMQREEGLRVAVVDDCPERLNMLVDGLYRLGADLYKFPLREVQETPSRLFGEMDLAVTTDAHFDRLETAFDQHLPLARLCLRLTDASLVSLARLPRGTKLGLLALSQPFSETLLSACETACDDAVVEGVRLFGSANSLEEFLSRCDAALAPAGFEQLCSRAEQEALMAFSQTHPLVRLEVEPDEGSLQTLETMAARQRQIHGRK